MEQIHAEDQWNLLKSNAETQVSRTTAKYEFLVLELLNNLVTCYMTHFQSLTNHFSSVYEEVKRTNEIAAKKREEFEKNFTRVPELTRALTSSDRLIEPLPELEFPLRDKKKQKLSTSIEPRYPHVLRLIENEREFTTKIEPLVKLKARLLRDERLLPYTNSIFGIFSNAEEISSHHQAFLRELSELGHNWSASRSAGDFLEGHTDSMKPIYEAFARNYASSLLSLQKAKKFNIFATVLSEEESSEGVQVKELLPEILYRPVRLRNWLQSFQSSTPKLNADYTAVSNALKHLEELNEAINANGTSFEHIAKLQDIQGRIQGLDDLTLNEPHRKFVKEGDLSLIVTAEGSDTQSQRKIKKEDCHAFLFTDLIVFAKKQIMSSILKKRTGTPSYQYLDHGSLDYGRVEKDETRRAVYLTCSSKVFSMYWEKKEHYDSFAASFDTTVHKLQQPKLFGVSFEEVMLASEHFRTIIPPIVTDCVQFILSKGLYTKGLFRTIPSMTEVEILRKALDHGETVSFEETSPLTVAWLLLKWLRELPEPLMTYQSYDGVVTAESPEDARAVVERMPVFNQYVLEYIMGACEFVVSHSKTGTCTHHLAVILAPALIRKQKNQFEATYLAKAIQFVTWMIDDFQIVLKGIMDNRLATEGNVKRIENLFHAYREKVALQRPRRANTHERLKRDVADTIARVQSEQKPLSQSVSTCVVPKKKAQMSRRNFFSPIRIPSNVSVPGLVMENELRNSKDDPVTFPHCRACHSRILRRPMRISEDSEETWHPECFVCCSCRKQLNPQNCKKKRDKLYCLDCNA